MSQVHTTALPLSFSLEEALERGRRGTFDAWLDAYLRGPGNNLALADGLKLARRWWIAPQEVELESLTPLCGPGLKFHEEEDGWKARVENLASKLRQGLKVAPLVAEYKDGVLGLADGNHRYAALRAAGESRYWTAIWFNSREDFEKFIKANELQLEGRAPLGGSLLLGASIVGDYSERRAEGQRNASSHLINRFTVLLDQLSFDAPLREKIDGALELMLALHADQEPRPDGEPYVNHPLRVAIAAIQKFGVRDAYAICAALLHDTVEDQAETLLRVLGGALEVEGNLQTKALDALEGRFGRKVRSLVGLLTNPDFDAEAARLKEAGEARSASEIKNVLYKVHFFEIYEADVEAFAIKLADFSENALAIDNLPEGQKKQKLKAKYGPVLREALQKLQSPPTKLSVPDSTLAEMERVLRLSYAG